MVPRGWDRLKGVRPVPSLAASVSWRRTKRPAPRGLGGGGSISDTARGAGGGAGTSARGCSSRRSPNPHRSSSASVPHHRHPVF